MFRNKSNRVIALPSPPVRRQNTVALGAFIVISIGQSAFAGPTTQAVRDFDFDRESQTWYVAPPINQPPVITEESPRIAKVEPIPLPGATEAGPLMLTGMLAALAARAQWRRRRAR